MRYHTYGLLSLSIPHLWPASPVFTIPMACYPCLYHTFGPLSLPLPYPLARYPCLSRSQYHTCCLEKGALALLKLPLCQQRWAGSVRVPGPVTRLGWWCRRVHVQQPLTGPPRHLGLGRIVRFISHYMIWLLPMRRMFCTALNILT